MSSKRTTLLASTLVFPSFQMQETGLEGFGADTVQGGSNAPFEFTDLKGGFGIQNRLVLANPSTKEPLLGSTARVRFRLEDGALFFEDVVASPGLIYSLARKQFGTIFEFGLGPFQSELQLLGRDTGTAHVRVGAVGQAQDLQQVVDGRRDVAGVRSHGAPEVLQQVARVVALDGQRHQVANRAHARDWRKFAE